MPASRSLALLASGIAVCSLSGCLLLEPWGDFWHQTKRNTKPRTDGSRDFTAESQEEWKFVGEVGRRGQPVEKDPDQWYRRYIMSEKARDIEANLGFQ
jgi:hypothetical protein